MTIGFRIIIGLLIAVMIAGMCAIGHGVYKANAASSTAVNTNDREMIEYTITKNDKIKVLDAATVFSPRKITTTYWILCIDGYKFISLTQGSGADIIQLFEADHTPVPCK